MLFKQIDEILSGQKTQTRRISKYSDYALAWRESGEVQCVAVVTRRPNNGEWDTLHGKPLEKIDGVYWPIPARWYVGNTYAVQTGRGKPGVWWRTNAGRVQYLANPTTYFSHNELALDGWQPLRIRITAIRKEQLQDISEADARAEGVGSVKEYRALWDTVNGKGARWSDSPQVWVLEFEVVKEAQS